MDGISIKVASTDRLLDAAYTIRRCVYCDELGWRAEDELIDDVDDGSTHFIAESDSDWIASARMVNPETRFEMEKYFDLGEYRRQGTCVELGRLAVLHRHRKPLVAVAMFRAFYRYALSNGIEYFCVAGTLDNRLYRTLGFQQVGDPFLHGDVGQMTIPYVLHLPTGIKRLCRRTPRLGEYFLKPIEGIG